MSLNDTKAPHIQLAIKDHFEALSDTEKKYAHHFSRASHLGTRVVLRQVSPESEDIYNLILAIAEAVNQDYAKLESETVSKDDVRSFLEYSSQFLSNLGNFKSFGDAKFVPRLERAKFAAIAAAAKQTAAFDKVADAIYSTDKTLLGFLDKGHVTAYYGGDITEDEITKINDFCASKTIYPENTRVWKTGPKQFELRIASADTGIAQDTQFDASYEIPDVGTLKLAYGDSKDEFAQISTEMAQAGKNAANHIQEQMIAAYVDSFKTGSMAAHRESQKFWVKDLGPAVETNIGFIETYRDPAGVRGEWEGLVAVVNKERTKKFGALVEGAKEYVSQLPWDAEFEKDVFTPPDFLSLEVLTFAGSGIPAGINIPNYDDIRLTVGFKNVSLGNILSSKSSNEKITFVKNEDLPLFEQLKGPAFEVQVGIHELLGHGTGKLLSQERDGSFNYDNANPPIDPNTGDKITTYYKAGETWGSVFGAMAGSYEECRAECVAMYLLTNKKLLEIFGHTGQEADDVIYIGYLLMARAGLLALEFWDPATRKWGQPHMQARYSIMRSFVDCGAVELKSTKPDFSDLTIHLDRSKIPAAQKAVGEYLNKLHIYKCSADFEKGSALYNSTTNVSEEMASYREVVMDSKQPRRIFVQPNTVLKEDGTVELVEYDASEEGNIKSFLERRV
ncbi:putative dipeptidyl peptidase 3 [Yarrowia sp. B02]|nr:putative dipeptidyl peptidase 3 [Yarrowia sp. B02]